MAATYMLRKHLREREAMRSPEAEREREIDTRANELAKSDRLNRFPTITPSNAGEADRHFRVRLDHWKRALRT